MINQIVSYVFRFLFLTFVVTEITYAARHITVRIANPDQFEAARKICEVYLSRMGSRIQQVVNEKGVIDIDLPVHYDAGLPNFPGDKPSYLSADFHLLDEPLYKRAQESVWNAYGDYSFLSQALGGPHLSLTHSLRDVAAQAVAVIWPVSDPAIQRSMAMNVFHMHRADDFADAISADAARKLDFEYFEHEVSQEEFVQYAFKTLDRSGDLWRIHIAIVNDLHNHHGSISPNAFEIYNFGIRRLLRGSLIFSRDDKEKYRMIEQELHELSIRLPLNSSLQQILPMLSPAFLAKSIKPNLELVLPLAYPHISFETIMWQNLLLGPIVDVHNSHIEEKSEFLGESNPIADLNMVMNGIKRLSVSERHEIVVRLPLIVEQFRLVLSLNGLLDFYLSFLSDERIRPYTNLNSENYSFLLEKMFSEQLIETPTFMHAFTVPTSTDRFGTDNLVP
jgi:hypothetical protein